MPAVLAVYVVVIVPEVAVMVAVSPEQITEELTTTAKVGLALTIKLTVCVLVQPVPLVPVTVYVPVVLTV